MSKKNIFEQLTNATGAVLFAFFPVQGSGDMLAARPAAACSHCRACEDGHAVLKRSAGQWCTEPELREGHSTWWQCASCSQQGNSCTVILGSRPLAGLSGAPWVLHWEVPRYILLERHEESRPCPPSLLAHTFPPLPPVLCTWWALGEAMAHQKEQAFPTSKGLANFGKLYRCSVPCPWKTIWNENRVLYSWLLNSRWMKDFFFLAGVGVGMKDF